MHRNPLAVELVPGESIIWEGKPEKWPFISLGPLHLMLFVPFSLAWGGFFVYLEALAIQSGSLGAALLCAPFILVGLYLIGGRFWAGARCWRNTYYTITTERVLIRLGTVSPKVTSLALSAISSIALQCKWSGLGHLNFNSGQRHVFDSIFVWQPGPSYMIINGIIATVPSFRHIRTPEKVYEQLTSFLAQP